MKSFQRFVVFFNVICVLALTLSACEKKQLSGGGDIVQPLSGKTVILKFSGGEVTADDVKDQVVPQIKKLNSEAIEAYQRAGESAVIDKLLEIEAKKAGVANGRELLNKIVTSVEVTDAEVNTIYKENKLDKGYFDPSTGKTRKVSKDEVRRILQEQSKNGKRQEFIQSILAKAEIKMVLEEPRVQVQVKSTTPVLGNRSAKVIIHEFSDFQCPFCSRGKEVVAQIHRAYGDKVGIAFHHMPLNFHPEARPAAIASECAGKQGKFWEYHDKAFDNQKQLGAAQYPLWAKELGLKTDDFEKCLTDSSTAKIVDEATEYARAVGVNSTPTFFVNGKKLAGALPFAQFKQLIDQELK